MFSVHAFDAPHLIHPKYRSDIDGLRAVAILSVIAFHAFPGKVPGGFSGVDVFFVISGYLISTIVFSSLEHDRFSLAGFYVRRIQRIFPALILVLATGLALGWHLLFHEEFEQLGKHTAAGAGFVQNFILWRESGYFDNSAETKPLLHLWSLAVEEQFYIFWPLLLALVWKGRWSFLKTSAVIAAISFAANLYLMSRDSVAAFYLPFSRFWELMIGGMLAHVMLRHPRFIDEYRNGRSTLGLVLILAGFFVLNKDRHFPGWWALLPTLGAFFVISAGPDAWLNRKILSSRLLVFVGLISYPLYLWHWLLLSYLRILKADAGSREILGAVAVSVILSWLTYRFVEKLFRFGRKGPVKALILLSLMIVVGIFGARCMTHAGFKGRPINKKLDFFATMDVFAGSRGSDGSCERINEEKGVKEEVCLSNSATPQVMFVGDSHAMALYSSIFGRRFPLDSILVAGHACPTYPNLDYTPTFADPFGNNCTEIAREAQRIAEKYPSIRVVVMATYHGYSTEPHWLERFHFRRDGAGIGPSAAFVAGHGGFVEKMHALGKTVVFVEDVPGLLCDPKQFVKRIPYLHSATCEQDKSGFDAQRVVYNNDLSELTDKYPFVKVFRTENFFYDAGTDRFRSRMDNKWLYNDQTHLSFFASDRLLRKMRDEGYLSP